MSTTTAEPQLAKMQYEVMRTLGTGAGSTILLVRDKATGRKYALKVVKRQGPDDDIYVNQALVEWKVARMLNHPGILTVHDFGRHDATHFLVTELVDGKTLRAWVNDARPSLPDLLGAIAQAASALAATLSGPRASRPEGSAARPGGGLLLLRVPARCQRR